MTTMLALGVLLAPDTVSAECDGPIPSFRAATATAQRIVVGNVVGVAPGGLSDGADGRSSRFTLAVLHVLRGEAPHIMEIRDLATQPCAPVVVARIGDQIAIAFDAVDFDPPLRVNTVAWIAGAPAFDSIERVTVAEAFELAGIEVQGPLEPVPPADDDWPVLLIVAPGGGAVAFLLWSAVAWRQSRGR
jgi:hypothetical protein